LNLRNSDFDLFDFERRRKGLPLLEAIRVHRCGGRRKRRINNENPKQKDLSCEYKRRIRKRLLSLFLQSVNLGRTDPFGLNEKAQLNFG